MSNELKPCPFCGGEAKLFETPATSGSVFMVNCIDHACLAESNVLTKKKAIEAWNTRAEPEPPSGECATLFLEFDTGKQAKRFAREIQRKCPEFTGWHVNPASIMHPMDTVAERDAYRKFIERWFSTFAGVQREEAKAELEKWNAGKE